MRGTSLKADTSAPATPKTLLASSNLDQKHCPLCDTALPSSWHNPPSHHAFTAIRGSAKKRVRSEDSHKQSKKIEDTGEKAIRKQNTPEDHPCLLPNCSRRRRSRKKLRIHQTMKHYLEELERNKLKLVSTGQV